MPYRRKYKKSKFVTKSQLNKIINKNIETKHKSLEFTNTSVSDSALNYELTQISTGDGSSSRDGHQIKIQSLFARFTIAGADTTNVVRAVLYIPNDPNLELTTLSTTNVVDYDSVTVLHDKLITLNSNGTNLRTFYLSKKFKRGMRVQYDSTGGSSCSKNPIKLAFVSDSELAGHPELNGSTILYYKDN